MDYKQDGWSSKVILEFFLLDYKEEMIPAVGYYKPALSEV